MRFETRNAELMRRYEGFDEDEKRIVEKIKPRDLKKVYVAITDSQKRREIYEFYVSKDWKKEVKRLTRIRNELGGSASRLDALERVVNARNVNLLSSKECVMYGVLKHEYQNNKKKNRQWNFNNWRAKLGGF
tara:strand:- start:213 stop:608 length:396 start_codon:yes stop_codon:yes gene_type:complete